MQQHGDDGRDLQDGLELPVSVGGEDDPFIDGDGAQPRDHQLTADDQDDDPRFSPAEGAEHDEHGTDEDLVRQGIKELAHAGDHVVAPGHITVGPVRDGSGNECQRGQHTGHRALEIQQHDDERNQQHAQQRQFIRKIEHILTDRETGLHGNGYHKRVPEKREKRAGILRGWTSHPPKSA